MKRIFDLIETKAAELGRAPLFRFLADRSIPPAKRLSFAPAVAHFVMSFADLYALVLAEEPTEDELQRLVNAHVKEDENHWRWFLADLEKLELDKTLSFGDALRFIWSPQTAKTRMLTYGMCRLGLGASSLEKLVLAHCIEAAGKVTVGAVSAVGGEYGVLTGRKLVYLGPHHSVTEAAHTIEDHGVHERLASISFPPAAEPALERIVHESFVYFTDFAADMLAAAEDADSPFK